MAFYPQLQKRRSIRLPGFDYTQTGLYFITICVQDRKCLFGEITNGPDEFDGGLGMQDRAPTRGAPTLILNDAGYMVEQEWLILPQRFPGIKLHEYIIMPNHFHGIIETVGAPLVGALSRIPDNIPTNHSGQIIPSKHIGQIIGAFKSYTTNAYIKGVKTQNWPEFEKRLWQRNYWEHIIRTPEAYQNISNYIIHNPETWQTDSLQSEIPKAA